MKVYWSLKSIPEISQLSSKERLAAWRRVYWITYRHWPTWVGFFACAGCLLSGHWLGERLGHSVLGVVAGGGLGAWVSAQFSIYVARRNYGEMLERSQNLN